MAMTDQSPHSLTREEMIEEIKSLEPDEFASRYLLDRVPWLFTDRHQYISWKSLLASELDVDPFMLIVVGSAGLGFSLSPLKGFSEFGVRSDIDVAIVSQRYFDDAWRWLRGLRAEDPLQMDRLERDMLKRHRNNLVFDGAIATERLLPKLPFASQWTSALGHAGTRDPTIGREVKARIYRDFESLRTYHVTNIREWKVKLLTGNSEAQPQRLGNIDERKHATNNRKVAPYERDGRFR